MKHVVTDLNNTNELVMFSNSILGNFSFGAFFGELEVELSPLENSNKQYELFHITHIFKPHCTIVDTCTKVDSKNCTYIVSSVTNFSI